MHKAILAFWFEQCPPWQWFRRSESFDLEVCQRFGSLVEQTMAGGQQSLELKPSPCLALVLLLDQSAVSSGSTRPEPLPAMNVHCS